MEIHAILRETLACFLPGRAKDLSAALYNVTLWRLRVTIVALGMQQWLGEVINIRVRRFSCKVPIILLRFE